MVVVAEKHRTGKKMTLAEVQRTLAKYVSKGKVDAAQRERLQGKMREILRQVGKVSAKGGKFAQIELSDEAVDLYEHCKWA